MKIVAWNVSGLRSCVSKGCVDYLLRENADIICLSEVKCRSEEEVPVQMRLSNYHTYWNVEKGKPGVGLLTKVKPLKVSFDLPEPFSDEKRLINAEYNKFFLVCCYVVNAGRGLKTLDKRLKWNKIFDEYIKDLDKKKPVIIAGDLNVAHNEIDLANPKSNHKTAGFTKEERDGFTKFLSYGFIDTFRELYPDQTGAYTFWSYMRNSRAKNVGWRLDYFIVSKRFMTKVKDNVIRSSVRGSDHCPIVLYLKV
ncbi:DNA repair nuclease APEX1-like [Chironomus tepperi]|uniref:DNA repair nuclease APEX1-like n=1 Tax=Chironomus tepperi TaxID=113505 RepID=UPI00391EF7F3